MSIASSIRVTESAGITFLDIENPFASARVSLFGGHVLSYTPRQDNQERLWLSPHAVLSGEKPIRGGIPVCWPWFSDAHGREKGALPSHGFLRNQVWQLIHSEDTDAGTSIRLAPAFTRADGFEYDCEVALVIEIGEQLSISLLTTNQGVVPFTFNTALHSYFQVDSISQVRLTGLTGDYKDKTDNWAVKSTPDEYAITGETDRIHLHAAETVTLQERGQARTLIHSSGHDSVVVWNPWQGAASISDMDAFGYKHMLCIETACTQDVTLVPGEEHCLRQQVAVPD